MASVIVTGITGQDGSYLAERLLGDGWDVHAIVREEPHRFEQEVVAGVSVHRGDLLDSESLRATIDEVEPDLIVNLAGISSVAQSWSQPELTARVTGFAVSSLLAAAWDLQERLGRPVRFVQASSSEMFGAATELPQTERTAIAPISPYGAAKAYAHHLVGVYRGRGLFAASAILYNHESPRRPETFVTRKITQEVARIKKGTSTELLLGNLDARRDWGWAPDYVDALVRIARADVADDFIVATGVDHSVRDFVAAAFAAVGISEWEHLVALDPRFARPVDAPVMLGDSSKLRSTLGWSPTRSFEQVVAAMVTHDLELLG
ncbi:GDP-mannose 4,6-dehydratase [Cryobacterium sp. TMT1-19]|uniref:GDP-mannose 4,6-dehydratase n=1 Tax=Cryobacterium sp. TMT1-19 TaxID=1259231 RepID=UPI00106BF89D|nr:GDP-mannose 4,6-dehydratase [Cryobacterium sp. TMT1-19]TFD39216.1 GDP-mannose 4,6-dehydratase [Cryobacterium sp. TMT1-19]